MAEIVEKSVTTESDGPKAAVTTEVKRVATGTQTTEYLIYFFLGTLEILLGFRFIFKIAGANSQSGFVDLIYGITGLFVMPFERIFRSGYADGVETTSVFEPATLVAIIVYAVLGWGIVKLIRIFSGEKQTA